MTQRVEPFENLIEQPFETAHVALVRSAHDIAGHLTEARVAAVARGGTISRRAVAR
jgi:hypothetical protein